MEFAPSQRCEELRERLRAFMVQCVHPAEAVHAQQVQGAGDPHFHAPVLEELKREARARGLWNLFHPDPAYGPGLTNVEYAPLAEIMGRSPLAPEACNCNAPDTGNMEVLSLFGSEEQKRRWLQPLLDGAIRSSFAMTEPDVASSDATNVRTVIRREGDEYVLNGHKTWITNAWHPNVRIMIVMGKTDTEAEPHRQQSMVVVPFDTDGVNVIRSLSVFGYHDREGHADIELVDVRVPVDNLVAGEGDGFMISQARLGPGRIHHAMRAVGIAERALELLCARAASRTTFGQPVSSRANIQDWIAEARIEIEMIRLLTLKTAWMIDTVGARQARTEIAAIKVAAPAAAQRILDRAIQVHGAAGVGPDFPLAALYAHVRTLRLADGPDEVHKMTIARRELRDQAASATARQSAP
jgi:acyl-CoA dehydrogenase